MNRINKILLMIIAMVIIMIAAVGIDKAYDSYEAKRWEKERVEIYETARADIADMQATIQTLAHDQDAIIAYIEENELNYVDVPEEEAFYETEQAGDGGDSISGSAMWGDNEQEGVSGNTISGDSALWGGVSGNGAFPDGSDVSGNGAFPGSSDVSGNGAFPDGSDVSGNGAFPDSSDVSGNGAFPGDRVVSGNRLELPEDIISGSLVSANHFGTRKKLTASYQRTLEINGADEKTIKSSVRDFSHMKIACLGDSITAATNLEGEDGYEQLSYPYRLKKILGAGEVTNLGIGGSSIGRYWENAFVDRYQEIDKDTDLILVMGGTNDGFCVTQKELGSFESREKRTFIGDLDELIRGLRKNYPDAEIVFATPLPNVLHDMLRKDRDYLLPQTALVKVIIQLAEEYDIPVIDLYNSELLDTHDAAVIYNFMPDGVHGNKQGYEILAEHFAAEIIRMLDAKEA